MKLKSFTRKASPWTSFLLITCSSVTLATATPSAPPTGDHEIASFIELDVNLDQQEQGAAIKVDMENGIAILTGDARSLGETERAASRAMSTSGVRAVVNAVKIKAASESAVLERVGKALETQRMVDSGNVEIVAEGGRVTLTGSVASTDDKNILRDLVATVQGVAWIENDLQISGGHAREDARIAEHLKFLIKNDPAFQGLDIAVTVRSGSVGLSGQVGSSDEMGRLMRLCRVEGVSGFRTSALTVNKDLAMEAFEEKNYGKAQALRALSDALNVDARIHSDAIRLQLEDGEMILRGRVNDLAAKEAAESDARSIPGVAMVRNELVIQSNDQQSLDITVASPPLVLPQR